VYPASSSTANGPLPPPDKTSGAAVAAGTIFPELVRCRAGLSGTQVPCRRARIGADVWVRVSEPSGLALVIEVGVVIGVTVTG